MPNEILEALLELGLTPIDWGDASLFSKLTGIAEQKLDNRRKNWPQDLVWTKQDGVIQYSIRGYNQWLTEQAQSRYRKACGSETAQSKSISNEKGNHTGSHYRTPKVQRVSRQPLRLETN